MSCSSGSCSNNYSSTYSGGYDYGVNKCGVNPCLTGYPTSGYSHPNPILPNGVLQQRAPVLLTTAPPTASFNIIDLNEKNFSSSECAPVTSSYLPINIAQGCRATAHPCEPRGTSSCVNQRPIVNPNSNFGSYSSNSNNNNINNINNNNDDILAGLCQTTTHGNITTNVCGINETSTTSTNINTNPTQFTTSSGTTIGGFNAAPAVILGADPCNPNEVKIAVPPPAPQVIVNDAFTFQALGNAQPWFTNALASQTVNVFNDNTDPNNPVSLQVRRGTFGQLFVDIIRPDACGNPVLKTLCVSKRRNCCSKTKDCVCSSCGIFLSAKELAYINGQACTPCKSANYNQCGTPYQDQFLSSTQFVFEIVPRSAHPNSLIIPNIYAVSVNGKPGAPLLIPEGQTVSFVSLGTSDPNLMSQLMTNGVLNGHPPVALTEASNRLGIYAGAVTNLFANSPFLISSQLPSRIVPNTNVALQKGDVITFTASLATPNTINFVFLGSPPLTSNDNELPDDPRFRNFNRSAIYNAFAGSQVLILPNTEDSC